MYNLPNYLTMLRIVFIPIVVATFYFAGPVAAWSGAVLFGLAAVTDYLDGFLARRWKQTSVFGRVWDPIADKVLVGAVLIMLAATHRLGVSSFGAIPAVIIMSREILVSGLREFLAGSNVGLPVTHLAKYKTACQMLALPMLIISHEAPDWMYAPLIGEIALWFAACLTMITGYDYLKKGMEHLKTLS